MYEARVKSHQYFIVFSACSYYPLAPGSRSSFYYLMTAWSRKV